MRYVLFFIVTSYLVSCSSTDSHIPETISMEDLMGKEEVEAVNVEDNEDESNVISDGTSLSNMVFSLRPHYDTIDLLKRHKLDRFGYSSSDKVRFVSKLDTLHSFVDVYQYHFSDSVKLNNAFYNWLDCFGQNCIELKLGIDSVDLNIAPTYALIYDTTLISVNYSPNFNKSDFKSFKDSVVAKFGEAYRYKILTNAKGDLKWK